MRYSSALVLSTLAVGQAAAANINRHASFHARRHAMEERNANYENVDWKKVSYDLSGVDWNSVFGKKTTSTSTPTPTPTTSKKEEVKAQAATTTAAYTTPAAAKITKVADASETKASGKGLSLSTLVEGVSSFFESMGAMGITTGLAPQSNNGAMWLGDDSNWKTTFINDGSKDLYLVCWTKGDSAFISKNTPQIAIKLPSGSQQTVSHADNVPGACAPAYSGDKLASFGALAQVWYEFTYVKPTAANSYARGTFDLSRNPAMGATVYKAKGSKCQSDASTCVFQCTKSDVSCQYDYELVNCSASNGGGQGWDSNMQGVGGGCNTGDDSEHVTVTFS